MSVRKKPKRKRSKPLIIILGPTASGKTRLAIKLAKKFDGEIVNADSRVMYKELPVVSAAPSPEDLSAVPHHLVGIASVKHPINLHGFLSLARKAIMKIHRKKKIPFVVGGSALYVNALTYGYKPKRIKVKRPMPYKLPPDTLVIGLRADREQLKTGIGRRFDKMIGKGVLKEIESLSSSFPVLGMRELTAYILGKTTLREAKKGYIKASMKLVKHQMTWFKRDKNIHWVKDHKEAKALIEKHLKG